MSTLSTVDLKPPRIDFGAEKTNGMKPRVDTGSKKGLFAAEPVFDARQKVFRSPFPTIFESEKANGTAKQTCNGDEKVFSGLLPTDNDASLFPWIQLVAAILDFVDLLPGFESLLCDEGNF